MSAEEPKLTLPPSPTAASSTSEEVKSKQEEETLILSSEELEARGDKYRREKGSEINPYFFKIEKSGQISYLLGTSHCLPFSILHPKCQETIKSTDILVCENATSRGGPHETSLHSDINTSRSEVEPHWYKALPPQCQTMIRYELSGLKIAQPAEQLSFRAINILLGLPELGFGYPGGMDTFIEDHFITHKKPIYSLDRPTLDQTLYAVCEKEFIEIERYSSAVENISRLLGSLMEGIKTPLPGQQELVQLLQQELENFKALLIKMADSYQSLDINRFYDWCQGYWSGILDYDAIGGLTNEEQDFSSLGERNLYWLPKISQLHHTLQSDKNNGGKTLAVVVGMGHLLGEKYGLLNLLQQSGFKIERMNSLGIFEKYEEYNSHGCLTETLTLQARAYDALRDEILNPQKSSNHNRLHWMYPVDSRIERKEYQEKEQQDKWEQLSQEKRPPPKKISDTSLASTVGDKATVPLTGTSYKPLASTTAEQTATSSKRPSLSRKTAYDDLD